MERLLSVILVLVAAAAGVAQKSSPAESPQSAAQAGRPHIVLVMADDQGWGDMGYTGHPVVQTPHFDAAAGAGLRFDRFYAAAPVCSPTRASVLTGRHPNRVGVFKWGYSMRPQEETLAEALGRAGYVTAHFGKWHLGSVRAGSPDSPGTNGFQEWLSAPNFYDNDPLMSRRGRVERVMGEGSMIAVDAAIEWMDAQRKGPQPMLAVVWFGSPHAPHRAAEKDAALYEDQPARLRQFYGEITGMDRAFGKLRRTLRTWGIHQDTVLWYCSDNGALPRVGRTGGFRGHKGKVFDGGLLVPAFVEWPARISRPWTTQMRCNTCDIFPTLLALAGVARQSRRPLDGVDLSPMFAAQQRPDPVRAQPMGFWDRDVPGQAVYSGRRLAALQAAQEEGRRLPPIPRSRDAGVLPEVLLPLDSFPGHAAWIAGNWKLHRIQDRTGAVTWQLYDLAADPREARDRLAAEAERVARMRADLVAWLGSVVRCYNGRG